MADILGRAGKKKTAKIVFFSSIFSPLYFHAVIKINIQKNTEVACSFRRKHEVVDAQHVDIQVHEGGHYWLPLGHPG